MCGSIKRITCFPWHSIVALLIGNAFVIAGFDKNVVIVVVKCIALKPKAGIRQGVIVGILPVLAFCPGTKAELFKSVFVDYFIGSAGIDDHQAEGFPVVIIKCGCGSLHGVFPYIKQLGIAGGGDVIHPGDIDANRTIVKIGLIYIGAKRYTNATVGIYSVMKGSLRSICLRWQWCSG